MVDKSRNASIEVAYALPAKQRLVRVLVPEGTTMRQAVELSGIIADFPELDAAHSSMGIFGKIVAKPDEHIVKDGDRVEIYRPLIADPKEARKRRAEKLKAAQSGDDASV